MPSLRHLIRLVIRGKTPHAPWSEPPHAAHHRVVDAVEVWKDGLCVSLSWQAAKYRGQGTHTYRISITRWYQDREGIWRNSSALHAEDLPILGELVAECVRKLADL